MKEKALLLLVATLAQASNRLEIRDVTSGDYTINLLCEENFFNGQTPTLRNNISFFLYNETSQLAATLLEQNNVQYVFDRNLDGTLRFNVRQAIEGYYYCSRDMSAGVPDNRELYRTILACPIQRRPVKTSYIAPVGGSVTLLSGVGPGALREHYRARWFKRYTELRDTNILDGDDFSLFIESLRLSDTDTYYSVVDVCDLPDDPCTNPRCSTEHETLISLTVYGGTQYNYDSPTIARPPESIVVGEKDSERRVSFTCIVTGAPSLKVSWFRGQKNLTNSNPSHYSFNEIINNGSRVTSVLTIHDSTYQDSGDYTCVATILGDKTGNDEFTAKSNTTLTVIESDFILNTVVTEHQQLQLWVELHAPLIAEVRAIVYFTASDDKSIQKPVISQSILTANKVMVFLLESHEIPDSIREDDFLVQVALKVGMINGSQVPRRLMDASIFNLDEPTRNNCPIDGNTYAVIGIVTGCVAVALAIMIMIISIAACFYNYHKYKQRNIKCEKMSDCQRKRIEEDNKEMLKNLRDIDDSGMCCWSKNKTYIRETKKTLKNNRGILRGDDASPTGGESTGL